MRLPTAIVAMICTFAAHAAYLAPWNPCGGGTSVGTAADGGNVGQCFKPLMRMPKDSNEFILNALRRSE